MNCKFFDVFFWCTTRFSSFMHHWFRTIENGATITVYKYANFEVDLRRTSAGRRLTNKMLPWQRWLRLHEKKMIVVFILPYAPFIYNLKIRQELQPVKRLKTKSQQTVVNMATKYPPAPKQLKSSFDVTITMITHLHAKFGGDPWWMNCSCFKLAIANFPSLWSTAIPAEPGLLLAIAPWHTFGGKLGDIHCISMHGTWYNY